MDINEFKDIMDFYAKKINIELNEKQFEKFYEYMNLLIEWNQKINLTAITEPKEIIIKHFIDSLTIEKYIETNTVMADVGTGAGFPGIPVKIVRPDVEVVLIDSLNKRINFLNEVIEKLELKNIKTIHSRIEDIGKDKKYREKFDLVTARAVSNLTVLSEYLIPLAKKGGKCVCMKGSEIEEEYNESKNAIKILGGELENIEKFEIPETDISRNIVLINKINQTPAKYPRKPGIPQKEPLK